MPSAISGFTGQEILTYVQNYIGNQSVDLQAYLTTVIPLAEMRFCKAHNWSFLNKTNLALLVTSGTVEYDTSISSTGYYIAASQIKSIFSSDNGIYLRKVSLDEIRRFDPRENAGTTGSKLTHWCEIGDSRILVYPDNFVDTNLRIDAKVTPGALLTLTNYPTIPLRYQESFMDYVVAIALMRENDTRAPGAMQETLAKIRMDIQDDLAMLGDTDQPRIRALQEQRYDGNTGLPDPLNMMFSNFTS